MELTPHISMRLVFHDFADAAASGRYTLSEDDARQQAQAFDEMGALEGEHAVTSRHDDASNHLQCSQDVPDVEHPTTIIIKTKRNPEVYDSEDEVLDYRDGKGDLGVGILSQVEQDAAILQGQGES